MVLGVNRTTVVLSASRLDIFCVILGCTPTWTSQADTGVLDGLLYPAAVFSTCLAACIVDAECTGVDWDPGNPAGQHCWFSGPWSGRRNNNSAPGITRYDLVRQCKSK